MQRFLSWAVVFSAVTLTFMLAPVTPAADEIFIVSLYTPDGLHPIRSLREGKYLFLHLGDVANAVEGAWGKDPLSREPLFTWGEHRILFSTRDRRVSVDGRRYRLDRAAEIRDQTVYVSADFIDEILGPLMKEPLLLEEAAPPEPSRPRVEPKKRPEPPPPWSGQGRTTVRSIVIDPGHGGSEEGAQGPKGLLEKDVVLDVATRLQQRLERRGYDVRLTRSEDTDVPLEERTAIANNQKADLFISLHANASPSRRARGVETYYLSLSGTGAQNTDLSHEGQAVLSREEAQDPLQMILWDMAQSSWLSESSFLAVVIQEEFNDMLDIRDRGVKQAPLRVLIGATMPAVLVEIGFISNPEEEERLQDPSFLNLIAESLSRSVDRYRRQMRRRGRGQDLGMSSGAERGQP